MASGIGDGGNDLCDGLVTLAYTAAGNEQHYRLVRYAGPHGTCYAFTEHAHRTARCTLYFVLDRQAVGRRRKNDGLSRGDLLYQSSFATYAARLPAHPATIRGMAPPHAHTRGTPPPVPHFTTA